MKPILFSGPMVRALRDGAKTQTRRLHDRLVYAAGDRLWVRETFAETARGAVYRADFPPGERPAEVRRWTPSIHMPQRLTRMVLEVTWARMERLQDISEADAAAEGVTRAVGETAIEAFARLWDALAEGADRPVRWADNPHVAVYGLRLVHDETPPLIRPLALLQALVSTQPAGDRTRAYGYAMMAGLIDRDGALTERGRAMLAVAETALGITSCGLASFGAGFWHGASSWMTDPPIGEGIYGALDDDVVGRSIRSSALASARRLTPLFDAIARVGRRTRRWPPIARPVAAATVWGPGDVELDPAHSSFEVQQHIVAALADNGLPTGVVALQAPAGWGKSHLAAHLAHRLRALGANVLLPGAESWAEWGDDYAGELFTAPVWDVAICDAPSTTEEGLGWFQTIALAARLVVVLSRAEAGELGYVIASDTVRQSYSPSCGFYPAPWDADDRVRPAFLRGASMGVHAGELVVTAHGAAIAPHLFAALRYLAEEHPAPREDAGDAKAQAAQVELPPPPAGAVWAYGVMGLGADLAILSASLDLIDALTSADYAGAHEVFVGYAQQMTIGVVHRWDGQVIEVWDHGEVIDRTYVGQWTPEPGDWDLSRFQPDHAPDAELAVSAGTRRACPPGSNGAALGAATDVALYDERHADGWLK